LTTAGGLLAQHGPNAIVEAKGPSHLRQFLANFVQLLALLLWAGAGLALLAGMPELTAAIIFVILVNAVFSYFQEHRAEEAVAALRKMLRSRCASAATARPSRSPTRTWSPATFSCSRPATASPPTPTCSWPPTSASTSRR
jgi:magnesium-transporting ATPase (P-type)